MVTNMAAQYHKYWFICFIDPKDGRNHIYKTSHTGMRYQVDAEAQNLYGSKSIPFAVVGVDDLSSNSMGHIKAEAMKLTGEIGFARRASHSVPSNPCDIINQDGNNTA
jgi:hypothetical protein